MPEWRLKVDDKQYTFDVKMVTVEALTHVKQWYGKELGRYNSFIEAFFEGDPDAAKCAIWIARRAAGETNVPEPKQMDGSFTLNQWLDMSEVEEEDEGGPKPFGGYALAPDPRLNGDIDRLWGEHRWTIAAAFRWQLRDIEQLWWIDFLAAVDIAESILKTPGGM